MQRINSPNISYNDIYPEENMKTQFYAVGNAVADRPGEGWFFLLAFRAEGTYIAQIAIGMIASRVYYRRFTIGSAGSWSQIL